MRSVLTSVISMIMPVTTYSATNPTVFCSRLRREESFILCLPTYARLGYTSSMRCGGRIINSSLVGFHLRV